MYALSLFGYVRIFATLWTVALQAPLSMELSRQEYWSGSHYLLQGSNPGILHCRQILYRLSHQVSPTITVAGDIYFLSGELT